MKDDEVNCNDVNRGDATFFTGRIIRRLNEDGKRSSVDTFGPMMTKMFIVY